MRYVIYKYKYNMIIKTQLNFKIMYLTNILTCSCGFMIKIIFILIDCTIHSFIPTSFVIKYYKNNGIQIKVFVAKNILIIQVNYSSSQIT